MAQSEAEKAVLGDPPARTHEQLRTSTQVIYRPLDASKREIRVLELQPFSGKPDDILHCTLRHISLDADPKAAYETISYCWGDPRACHDILLNGQLFKVPKNTVGALQRVAHHESKRTVWIDAVCINQKDDVERAQQVSLMGDVYSGTTCGLVYLGPEASHPTRAIADIEALVQDSRQVATGTAQLRDIVVQNGVWAFAPSPLRFELDRDALIDFFGRPWFRRIWITQEAVLTKESICFYGNMQISLDAVLDATAWMVYHTRSLPKQLTVFATIRLCCSIWEARFHGDLKPYLAQTVYGNTEREATDDRDRVYGLLGLTRVRNPMPDLIRPDYGKSYDNVMRDLTRYGIEVEHNYRTFDSIHHRSQADIFEEGWPSWVPRVHRPFDSSQDAVDLNIFGEWKRIILHERSKLLDVLCLEGFTVGVIEKISVPIFVEDTRESLLDPLQTVFTLTNKPIKLDTALHRTLLGGVDYRQQRGTGATWADFPAFADCIQDPECGPPLPEPDPDSQDMREKFSRYCRSLEQAARHRKFAVLNTGQYALVPKVCEVGDTLAILQDFELPAALRFAPDRYYRMLGPAYVDGIMWADDRMRMEIEQTPNMVFQIR